MPIAEKTAISQATLQLFDDYVIPNYGRFPLSLVRGEGSHVWDDQGNRYLDFFPGWGCNLLGHCPDPVVKAVQEQVAELIHVPNSWYMEAQGQWAKLLSERSFGGQAFFCNSGTEANEAAIKLARLNSSSTKYKIISFEGSFHGRTYAATTATAQPKYHEGIGPLLPGFIYAPFGNLEAVAAKVDDETTAILVEPIQGEGGIRIPPEGFLNGLRKLADERGLLLIFDEVQAGCGRTGKWFAYQHFGVEPDIMTLAKSLCGGIAGGAMLARKEIAKSLRPGMHAATFGGNPIAARAGIATIEMIEELGLLQRATELGEGFRRQLATLVDELPYVAELRICGLMIGLELRVPGAPIVQQCLDRGLLINCTQGNVIRLLPAMTLSDELLESGCEILANVLREHNP
ncbi:aspartate aminotransferase family protein [Bythopirellula polymerisocia]|uniref:Acetylornithine aminotransferase n=1 Tax=Bythopirellula polymerisocia TaxID=2528003 RepID=A0A5C6CYE1_9BACT|nr:aspartate aminotransferase family protein [Bythopirellula polymerisocia]TWU28501.1 Acetylornithine aminotransferase [Bythopirellula polymerisocia]